MTKVIRKRNKLGQFTKAYSWENIVFMKTVKRVSFKLLAFALIVGLNGVALSQIGYTMGYYNDEESSTGNTFKGGMLDIVLSNTEFDGVISNSLGDQSQFETNVSLVDGSLPTQYDIEYEQTGGDDSMCDALALNATSGTLSYDGALSAFSIGTTNDFGLWSFIITVLSGESVTAGETCEFDLVYKAWIDGVSSFDASGYYDEERFHISIEAAEVETPVVINEFLPNPDGILCTDGSDDCAEGDSNFIFDFGADSDDMPQGEWVELYNLTGSPIDLTDWYVQDASGGVGNTDITNLNSIPATLVIPAHGFLVVYMNKRVWNNTGDTVKLFNANNVLQDSYAYTSDYDYCYLTPTPGGTNDETPSGAGIDCTPGATIPKNKSYARMPDGTGAFVDPVPTPGVRNSLDEASAPEILVNEENAASSTENIASKIADISPTIATEVVLEIVTEILETIETLIPVNSESILELITESTSVIEKESVIVPELIPIPVPELTSEPVSAIVEPISATEPEPAPALVPEEVTP